jgi:aconitate hydratase
VLPLTFKVGTAADLKLDGSEIVDIEGVSGGIKPGMDVACTITRKDGSKTKLTLRCRIDTLDEVEYFKNGGILQYVLRDLAKAA